MHTEFQLPHITGRTTEERLHQVIVYLRQLAFLLQELPAQQDRHAPARESSQRPRNFDTLTVRDRLKLEGDLNGIFLRYRRLKNQNKLLLQSRFAQWEAEATQSQSLFLLGSFCGSLQITGEGQCHWAGAQGVTVAAEAGGVVTVTFPQAVREDIIILSTERFD